VRIAYIKDAAEKGTPVSEQAGSPPGVPRPGYPYPGYFAERVWTCLIAKELGLLPTTKSPQEYVNNGVERLKRLHREFGRKLIPPTPPGNADDYQRKGFAGKAIRNYLKAQDMQIDRPGGATHKYMKTKGARK